MKVSLNTMPAYPQTRVVDFPELNGGLNLRDLSYRLEPNQSPDMKNLWWQNGILQSRDGQYYISDGQDRGVGYACDSTLFWGNAFFHIGDKLFRADMTVFEDPTDLNAEMTLVELISGVPENRGTFFRYGDSLYYKNKGGYFRIDYHAASSAPEDETSETETPGETEVPSEEDPDEPDTPPEEIPGSAERFSVVDMTTGENAYTPVIVINADPLNGSGTLYQPENRLSPQKEIHYNAQSGVTEYHLPVKNIDSVVKVTVDGTVLEETTDPEDPKDYTVDKENGVITFTTAPAVTTPPTNNTVEIIYSKVNADAYNSIMDCIYTTTAGSGSNLCVLMAGCDAQPNVVFWNSNDNLAMNPGYFPVSYYNLCGDTEDRVTGFGKQYNDLILFKQHSIGKLEFGIEQVDGRDMISFTYKNVNAKIGCDLPWTIQLVQNNLIFCNTHQGVHIVWSSSAAYENNILCISDNVNGSSKQGLLHEVRTSTVPVVSVDDNDRYWLCAGGKVYAWDYSISSYQKPSWFYFANIHGVAYLLDDANNLYHLNAAGNVTRFARTFHDYGEAIDKIYAFPTQFFGSYDRLKDVLYVLITVRGDTDSEAQLRYDTDYESRLDNTNLLSKSWRLVPRDLSYRYLGVTRFGHVHKRRPGCWHVRHFAMALGNNVRDQDLAIVSAQIYYRFSGKER